MMRTTIGLFLFATLAIASCSNADFRAEAVGEEGQVTVVVDSSLWNGNVGDALRAQIGAPIATLPSQEPMFALKQVSLQTRRDFDMVTARKNVLIVAALEDTSTIESRFLWSSFSDDARNAILEGGPAVVPRPDHWRRRQQVFYVAGGSAEDLAHVITEQGPGMVHQLNEITRRRLYREMFDIGRQHEIEEYLMTNHGFAVNGQHDYVIAKDTSNFVWLRRVLSDTWRSLFVYYEENADAGALSPDWVIRARDALTQRFVLGTGGGWVEVDQRRPLVADSVDFQSRFAFELRGLWHMVGEENGRKFPFGMGGPFLTYAFYDEPTRRIYLIDGMVFAPNYPKREFLRQLEVIAYTFRTQEPTNDSPALSARIQ